MFKNNSKTIMLFVFISISLFLFLVLRSYSFAKPTYEGFQSLTWYNPESFVWVKKIRWRVAPGIFYYSQVNDPNASQPTLPKDVITTLDNAQGFVNNLLGLKKMDDVKTYITVNKTGDLDAFASQQITLTKTQTKITPEYLATLPSNIRNWVTQIVLTEQIKILDQKEISISKAINGAEGKKAAQANFTPEQIARGDIQRLKHADVLKEALRLSVQKQAEFVATIDSIDKIIESVKTQDAAVGATLEAKKTDAKKIVEDALLAGKGREDSLEEGIKYLRSLLPATASDATKQVLDDASLKAKVTIIDLAKEKLEQAKEVGAVGKELQDKMKKFGKLTPAAAFGTALNALSEKLIGGLATAIADSEDAKCPAGYSPGGSITEGNKEYNVSSQVLSSVLPVNFFDYVNAGLNSVSCMRTEPDGSVKMAMRKRCTPCITCWPRQYCYAPIPEIMEVGSVKKYLQLANNEFLPNCLKPFTTEGLMDSAAQFIFEWTWDNSEPDLKLYTIITKFTKFYRLSDTIIETEFEFKNYSKQDHKENKTTLEVNRVRGSFIFEPTDFAAPKKFRSKTSLKDVTLSQQKIIQDITIKGTCEGRDPDFFCDNDFIRGYYKGIAISFPCAIIGIGETLFANEIQQTNFEPRVVLSTRFDPDEIYNPKVESPKLVLEFAGFEHNNKLLLDGTLQRFLESKIVDNKLRVTPLTNSTPSDLMVYYSAKPLVVNWRLGEQTGTVKINVGKDLIIEPTIPPAPIKEKVVPSKKDVRVAYWDVKNMPKEPQTKVPFDLQQGIEFVKGRQDQGIIRILGKTVNPNIEEIKGGNKTPEDCRKLGLKDTKYVAWGYRTEENSDAALRKTCYLYTKLIPYSGNSKDAGNITGCLKPDRWPESGCL